jgi:4-amino-4-deoxy-L-arabinose transferase-like glycosyltransferase
LVLRGRRPRTDLRRAAYLVWGGWLVVTMLVFSLMAGIFHEYYTVALAPAIGALVGMGATEAWERRGSWLGATALALATAAAAIWGFILLSRTTAYGDWLRFGVLSIGLAAAVLLLVLRGLPGKVLAGIAAVGVVAALAGPAAYSLTTVSEAHTGSIVLAGPAGATRGGGPGFGRPRGAQGPGGQAFGAPPFGGGGGFGPPPQGGPGGFAPPQQGGRGGAGGLLDAATPSTTVVAALSEDAQSYTWVAAAVGSQRAAGLQIATQLPVMAIGGFNGSDPSPTLEQFQQYVADGRIHYFAGGGPGFGGVGQMGGSSASSEIAAWVQENFQSVTFDGTTFYDLTQPVNGPVAVDAGMAT